MKALSKEAQITDRDGGGAGKAVCKNILSQLCELLLRLTCNMRMNSITSHLLALSQVGIEDLLL